LSELDQTEIKKQFNRLRALKSLRGETDDEIWARAEETIRKKSIGIDVNSLFKNSDERKLATSLLDKYLSDFSIENISDKNMLREVIFLEIVQSRLQEKLNEYYEKDTKALPQQLIDTIHKNSDAILKLKNNLGLSKGKDKKESSKDSFLRLQKRFKKWLSENQASRTIKCSHCGKFLLLKMRTTAWEAQKHPFFKDNVIYNRHVFKLYRDKTISKKDVSLILETSTDYIDWILDRVEKKQPYHEKESVQTTKKD